MIVVMVVADSPSELQGDGNHPDEQMVELLIAMRASIICPAASQEAALHSAHPHRHQSLQIPCNLQLNSKFE